MLKRIRTLGFALLALAAVGCGQQDTATNSTSTDTSSAPATGSSSAASATLEQAASSAPAVLYFVKEDCGSNPRAIPLVQTLYAANSGSNKFFVVMNADADAASRWASENKTTFPIIADPNKEIIGRYGVEASQTGVLVDKDLKEVKRFAGFGKSVLEEINASLAANGQPATVDLSGAPESGIG